jgi:hypothetical protein
MLAVLRRLELPIRWSGIFQGVRIINAKGIPGTILIECTGAGAATTFRPYRHSCPRRTARLRVWATTLSFAEDTSRSVSTTLPARRLALLVPRPRVLQLRSLHQDGLMFWVPASWP